jgi:hypothetical protein
MMDAGVRWKKTARPLYRDISTKKIERIKERASGLGQFGAGALADDQLPKTGL